MTNGSVAGSLRQRTWAPADGTRPGRRRPRRRWKVEDNTRILPAWLSRTTLVAMVLFVLVPVVYMLLLSVTPNSKVALGAVSLSKPDFGNYAAIWSVAPLAGGLVHTLIIAGAAAAISVAFGLLAAYPLTRMRFACR